MIVAQISDPHIGLPGRLLHGRYDTGASLARCLERIRGSRPAPDAVLATGDLVESGAPGEYEHLRALLAGYPVPVYLVPGNHDERAALRAAFGELAYLPRDGERLCYTVEHLPVRLIALDTVVPGAAGGALDEAQLAWLDAQLAAQPERPTLLFMHHPPFRTGIGCMDAMALSEASAQRLGAIVERHRQIRLVTCGHVHRDVRASWRGTVVSICPSTAFQGRLDFAAPRFEIAPEEPPAFQLHYWNGAEIVTHTLAAAGGQ